MNMNDMSGRTASFGQGSSGNPARVSSSLQADSARWTDEVGSGFNPQSVLNTTVGSGNGMNANDYSSHVLSDGSMLPNSNGMSSGTSTSEDKLLLDGKRELGTLGA